PKKTFRRKVFLGIIKIMNFRKIGLLGVGVAIITLIFGVIYAETRQSLRQSANDPQIQMAEDAAVQLSADINPNEVLPQGRVDLSTSLSPFIIVYDEAGQPV